MEEEIKCPVCGKAGIKNYHNEDVVCPCCGSDLSIFRVIEEVPNSNNKKGFIWKIITGVACLVCFIFAIVVFNYSNTIKTNKEQLAVQRDSLKTKDSRIASLKDELQLKQNTVISSSYHKHIVLKGDNLWRISRRYYGTGTRYKDIAVWNNISVNTKIEPGDTILIR